MWPGKRFNSDSSMMIEAQQLSKAYNGRNVVDGISFRLPERATMVLLGTSGCGKTTTLRMINRIIEPTAGALLIDGEDIRARPPEALRRAMGYVLQRSSLFPHYTVGENIAVVPQLLKWDAAKIRRRTLELIDKLHLPQAMLASYPGELSGGEAQRVNMARALMANPPILLMDEPFSALDSLTKYAIRQEFAALEELKNKTIVLVTHDVEEAFEMGDIICLMDGGKIVQQGRPEELLFRPVNDFVRDFLSHSFLQLSLAITTLRDVWPFLPDSISQPAASHLAATDTLAKAFSAMQDKNNPSAVVSVAHPAGEGAKTVSWPQLLGAFTQYKALHA